MIKCFTIRDKESGIHFETHLGKKIWAEPDCAENAWNEATQASRTGIYFDDQDQLVVEESVVINKELYDLMFDTFMQHGKIFSEVNPCALP